MNDKNRAKAGLYRVMGVKAATQDKTVQPNLDNPQWDKVATAKYLGATALQISLMVVLLKLMDIVLDQVSDAIPPAAVVTIACAFLAFLTLRSRLFSLLDNARNNGRYSAIQRPNWAPPPLAFPIIWMSIAVLRVISGYLVWSAMEQTFFCLPLMLFVAHLSLGDTWNTLFTVEGRLGAAVPMVVLGPFLSVAVVTISYYQTLPLAGYVILPSWIWLTVATVLCTSIWQINGKEPMYPMMINELSQP